jgi:drug/metabolite transporter (DMT)-like permease
MSTDERATPATGPVLVSLGAAGWGAENLFRTRLRDMGIASYPIVLVEHVLQVIFTLPWLLKHAALIAKVPRRALVYVFLSGAVGSSLGTVCYTAAMGTSVNRTVAAMLLNLQPIVSTLAGASLFAERIPARFYPWAALAIVSGCTVAVDSTADLAHLGVTFSGGLALVFATVALWGFATAAGRGAAREMPVGLAAPLRLWAGLFSTAIVIALRSLRGIHELHPGALLTAPAITNMLLLTTVTGAIPLFIYFAGLARTPASLAGYCEMFYTLSATFVGWAVFGDKLLPHQLAGAALLVFAIVQLNRGAPKQQ